MDSPKEMERTDSEKPPEARSTDQTPSSGSDPTETTLVFHALTPELRAKADAKSSKILSSERREKDRDTEADDKEAWQKIVGRRYVNSTLRNFEQDQHPKKGEVVTKLIEYCHDIERHIFSGHGLILAGPPGTGKDHLITAAARVAFTHVKKIIYISGEDLCAEIKETFTGDANEAKVFEKFTGASLLILSDPIDVNNKLTDWQRRTLNRIVAARYTDCRSTWVTINANNEEEAGQSLGATTYSRLQHDALVLGCNWGDFRKPLET